MKLKIWKPDGDIRAILLLIHGMTEHIGRYEKLIKLFNENQIAAAGFDLPGHGENPGDLQIAAWGENGWQESLEDIDALYREINKKYPEKPIYILGFSLGSFLVREYLHQYESKIAGAIIMGTGYQPGLLLSVMIKIVEGQVKKAGCDAATPLIESLSFGSYNRKFKPNRTIADWLCSDPEELDRYLQDPLCREKISAGLFKQLLEGMKRTGSIANYNNWKKEMPVLLISGQEDPVGDRGRGVLKVQKLMKKAGIAQVQCHILEKARHDVLHEEANGAAQIARQQILTFLEAYGS